MNGGVRIPIRVRPSVVSKRAASAGTPAVTRAAPPGMDRNEIRPADRPIERPHPRLDEASSRGPTAVSGQPEAEPAYPRTEPEPARETQDTQAEAEAESLEVWRDRALRLQAEIDNFRKRQQRLAEERISADREQLLRAFLPVADDLERALNADGADIESLRQGVGLTHQTMMRLLYQEGAEPIQAEGQPFDPEWHEAVGTLPHEKIAAEPGTVVQIVQTGYSMGDRLLRPARVIVAT